MRQLLLLVVAAAAAATALSGCKDTDQASAKEAPAGAEAGAEGGAAGGAPAMPPMPVEVAVARTDTVVDAISATGQVEAVQSIEVHPEIDGRIVQIVAREGTEVAKGAPLFRIDDAELRAEVARARADRDLARQALARTRDLLAQKASSQQNLEEAEAESRSTQAQLELLEVRLARTVVRAPFGGVLGERMVSMGDYVTSQAVLATLQTVNPQRVSFEVPERYAARLRRGQRVTFRVAALAGREFGGVVDFVNPVVRLPGRTITVKAEVPNTKRELQSGMFVEVDLATEMRPSAVVIPEDAVVPLQGANFVWVVADGKAARRQIGLGVRRPGFVEARSGLDAGDQVVVGGQERLQEGAPVQPRVVERRPVLADTAGAPGAADTTRRDSARPKRARDTAPR